MKKIIFLCLVSIICSVNIFAIRKAKALGKFKELPYREFSKVRNQVSLPEEILTRYIQ